MKMPFGPNPKALDHPLMRVGLRLAGQDLALNVHSAVSTIASGVHSLAACDLKNPVLAELLRELAGSLMETAHRMAPVPGAEVIFDESGFSSGAGITTGAHASLAPDREW